MATLFKTDGTTQQIVPVNGTDFSLEECQKYVGGYIETINVSGEDIMVVNEEGLLKGLPINTLATSCLLYAGKVLNQAIVGDVFICKRNQLK